MHAVGNTSSTAAGFVCHLFTLLPLMLTSPSMLAVALHGRVLAEGDVVWLAQQKHSPLGTILIVMPL